MGYDKKDNNDGLPEDNNKKEIETDDLEGLDVETQESVVDLTQEMGESPPPIEDVPVSEPETRAAKIAEEIQADFQPFYEKEAKVEEKVRKISSVTLYILLAGLGLALAALVVDVLFYGTGFKLEITAAAVVCFALIGIFWKSISQESKAGMVAVTIGIVLLWPRMMFIREGLAAPWDISAEFMWPILFLISPAAILFGIWLFWPRLGWIPALLSLPVLYVALSPVWSLVENSTTLAEIVEGPSFMGTWPIYLRSGYLLVEIVLPLGILLLLVLQARNLFRSHQKIHFGYLYWGLFLVLVSLIGFDGLEAQNRPVAVPFSRIASLGLPVSASISEPATPPSATVSATDTTPAPTQPEEPSTQPVSAATDETTAPVTKALAQEPDPGIEANNQRIAVLEDKIVLLEQELRSLQDTVKSQNELIGTLVIIFGDRLKEEKPPPVLSEPEEPQEPETPSSSNEEESETIPSDEPDSSN
ncbi:MAG: hypothetical protein V3V37_01420 [Candidatus Adiutricales bacterium]